MEYATFAAGCFWGVEAKFRRLEGVVDTEVGYTGGHTNKPTYEQVCAGNTGHAEAVRVTFDPTIVSYSDLVVYFFSIHDATTLNRQGLDVGEQYRSAIFTHNQTQHDTAQQIKDTIMQQSDAEIVTEIQPLTEFTRAEEYHQQYYDKSANG